MITYGFYNSLNHDRKYNAMQISKLFDGVMRDGVFSSIGSSLVVLAGSGMTVMVGTGRAWFDHTWTDNDAILPLDTPQSEMALNRIDAVILEISASDDVRVNSIKFIKGTPGSVPVAPTMADTEYLHQYPLAYIYVGAGVTSITQANITNKVGTVDCPFVTGVLQQITIDNLLAQWESEYQQWYTAAQNEVDLWKTDFESEAAQWYIDSKSEFDTWLTYIQSLYTDDPIGVLQGQIDVLKNSQGVAYDNTDSGLAATNVKDALDEVNAKTGGTGVKLVGKTTTFGTSNITETFALDGSTLVTTFNADGTITEAYTSGGNVITKTITFNADGSITEFVS